MATGQTPPGPRGLPLVGNTHQWARDPCAFRERCAAEYGEVVNYRLLSWDAYMVTDPAAVRRILVTEHDRFPKHEDSNAEMMEILGEGLLTTEGATWRRQRETIRPAFTMDHIRRYADVMVRRAAETAADLSPGEPVEMRECMSKLTLEIIVEAMLGEGIDLEERGIYEAVEAFRKPMQPRYQPVTFFAPDWAPIPFLRRAQSALDHLEAQIYDVVEARRVGDDESRDDLLGMLLSVDAAVDDEEIKDQLLTFLFAGHETTALTLTFLWDLLTRNPDAASRLRAEIDDAVEGTPGFGDLPALKYTEAAIREAMRLYPPAHEIRREPAEDVEIAGYTIPEGSLLVLPTWVLHRDDRFWEDPEAFRPERFLAADDGDRPDFAYFPFGGGPRHCIGKRFAMLEAQLIVATLAREWTFDRDYGDLDVAAAVSLQPSHDVPMVPRPR